MAKQDAQKVEFGDFQTPDELARQVAELIAARGDKPHTIVEPTCGQGSLLIAVLRQFPSAKAAAALEINHDYFKIAHRRVLDLNCRQAVDLRQADFFKFDWPAVFNSAPQPILVIGNPPWVTASSLGAMNSSNLPAKSNFQNHRGFDAISGKSNFDISEWILIHILKWLSGKQAVLAMLVKTAVARKVLFHAWKAGWPISKANIYTIDAKKHFGVGVDACLLLCDLHSGASTMECGLYDFTAPDLRVHKLAFHDGMLLADLDAFKRHRNLLQESHSRPLYRWRSGIKHDCAKVMELENSPNGMVNGHGQRVSIESDFVYPMLKGSSVANGAESRSYRNMIVTQSSTGEATGQLKSSAPRTWNYLVAHAGELDARSSSIYRKRPRFSIFGIGEYSFAPWKVAVCGLYKRLAFSVIGPRNGKPVMVDDTVYFLACQSQEEAELLAGLLHSKSAREFLGAFIFWDAKRPITADILGRLDIFALAAGHNQKDRLMGLRQLSGDTHKAAHLAGSLFSPSGTL